MNELALLDYAQGRGMQPLLLLVAMTVAGFGLWRFILWIRESAVRPDPWDARTMAEVESEEAQPLCHRCLEPHDPANYFCRHCGAPVGDYTNWLPFPYLFSVGDQLRLGTAGEFRRNRVNVFGFLLLSVAEYAVFAPIYWYQFFRHLGHVRPTAPAAPVSTEQID